MQDTPDHIKRKHYEIIMSKSPQEKFLMGLQMMDDARVIALNSIRSQHAGITETDLKIEFVKRYYKNDFSAEQMENIIKWFKEKSQIS